MNLNLRRKSVLELKPTALVWQTSFWGDLKARLGWEAMAFDIEADGMTAGDILVLTRAAGPGSTVAYAPFGPEELPDPDTRGPYLAALSEALRAHLGSSCAFIRYDLPWLSPYAQDDAYRDGNGQWLGPPENRLRELRMNWGVSGTGLRKAPSDILPPDTLIVDIDRDDEAILASMKPKTRYNVRLSDKRGVLVREGGPRDLGTWLDLHAATAARKGLKAYPAEHFSPLTEPSSKASDAMPRLLLAEQDGSALAAMFVLTSGGRATYLHGASADHGRQVMAPYALQWAAMRLARDEGCSSYDLFGVPPTPNSSHPMHGLYAFKTGFGGDMVHRQGAWDWPYDEARYQGYLASESSSSFHL